MFRKLKNKKLLKKTLLYPGFVFGIGVALIILSYLIYMGLWFEWFDLLNIPVYSCLSSCVMWPGYQLPDCVLQSCKDSKSYYLWHNLYLIGITLIFLAVSYIIGSILLFRIKQNKSAQKKIDRKKD